MDQFEFETEEGDALDYINDNFEVGGNETNVHVVLRDQENALSRESFLETLTLQQDLRNGPAISATLADDAFGDVASVVATEVIAAAEIAELENRAETLAEDRVALMAFGGQLSEGINETRDLQTEYEQLNAPFEAGEIEEPEYEENASAIEAELTGIEQEITEPLDDDQAAAYQAVLSDARSLQAEIVQTELAYEAEDLNESKRDARLAPLTEEVEPVYDRIETDVLGDEFAALEQRADALEEDQEALADLDPSIDEQQEQLEGMSDAEVEQLVSEVLGEDGDRGVFVFVPTDFEPSETETDARQFFVTQQTDTDEIVAGEAPGDIVDTQLAIADHVDEHYGEAGFTFGLGVITDEIDRSMADSLAIVLPLAFLFVLSCSRLPRDPLDIALGIGGIGLVLVWTFGFLGWTGITFNQIMIAVPVLLVGLSIDYAIHVFMRHRECRGEDDHPTGSAMGIVIVGLGTALLWVTITAVIEFLSNLVSPVPPIREFGIVSAFGIISTLLVFGILVPATRVFLNELLESRGWDRQNRAFGTGGGVLTDGLRTGNRIAQRLPLGILVVALLLTTAGLYGATQVDTEFDQEDFIAEEPPDWMYELPDQFAPGDYTVKSNMGFVNERFIRQDTTTQALIQGGVADAETLERIDAAEDAAAEEDAIIQLSDGEADVQSPLAAMRGVVDQDDEFADIFQESDTTENDIPDQNVSGVYDAFFDVAPEEAASFLHQTDAGEYEAARLVFSTEGDASAGEATDATRRVAETMEDEDRTSIATGQLVVFHVIEEGLFDGVIESLIVTFIAVFAFLMAAYRVIHGSALLGAVTLSPIVLAVAWILGTMHVLGIPFNVMIGTITSLTIGLGVGYNLHIAERYQLEIDRGHTAPQAMERAVTGTGGALLGSAATTVGGFGVLIFAILPPLQQFGLITD